MKTMKAKLSSKLLYLLSFALIISIAMLPMVTISGCDSGGEGRRSEQEPNNTFAECNLVGLSTIRIKGTIDPPGDIDFFCFDIEEPDTILDIEFNTDNSPLAPFLELFGPDQNPLADGETFIEFTVDRGGRYYVSVIDVNGQGGGDYTYRSNITSIPPVPPPPTPTPTASPTPTPTVTPTPTPTVTPTPMPQIHDVSMEDNFFDPQNITINVGDTVRWTNNGSLNHNAISDEGPGDVFSSNDEFPLPQGMQPGDVYEFTFTQEGDVPYFCSFHGAPGGIGMAGTVTVE